MFGSEELHAFKRFFRGIFQWNWRPLVGQSLQSFTLFSSMALWLEI